MEKELTMHQKQQLAKYAKQLKNMMKTIDAIMCDIDEYDDRPLDCAYFTIGETIDYLNTAINVY